MVLVESIVERMRQRTRKLCVEAVEKPVPSAVPVEFVIVCLPMRERILHKPGRWDARPGSREEKRCCGQQPPYKTVDRRNLSLGRVMASK